MLNPHIQNVFQDETRNWVGPALKVTVEKVLESFEAHLTKNQTRFTDVLVESCGVAELQAALTTAEDQPAALVMAGMTHMVVYWAVMLKLVQGEISVEDYARACELISHGAHCTPAGLGMMYINCLPYFREYLPTENVPDPVHVHLYILARV